MTLEIEIPAKAGFLFSPCRYKVLKGGRGSAKSWSAARALVIQGHAKRLRMLCARETQRSIKDSVHRLISDQLEALHMGPEWNVLRDEIRHRNGSLFLFTGLADKTADSIKSFEGIDRCWVEEAQSVSDRSWSILIPTIRKEDAEIWLTMNPELEDDPTYKRFVAQPPPDCRVVTMNWEDNPWFPEVLRKEKDHLYAVDPEAAAHVWGGECRRNGSAQVLRGRYAIESFEPGEHWDGPYQGVDWGFAVDPSVLVRCWIWEGTLYVEHEAYGLQTELDQLSALFDSIKGAREHVSRADSSRPETISHLQRAGYKRMAACTKWPGSVEDGVEYLRSFQRIVIHPRCAHTAEEARLWSFKVDKLSGDILPKLEDKHNHCWDAIRYALEPMVMGYAKKTPKRDQDQLISPYGNWGQSQSWMG